MKKLICLLFAAVMLLPLASCVPSSPEGTAAPTDALPADAESLYYNPETDADNRYINIIGANITEFDGAIIAAYFPDASTFYYYDMEIDDTSVSFLANVPHLPSSDYICKTGVMYIAGGVTYFDGSSAAPKLSMNTVYSPNGNVTGAYFDFIVNDTSVLHCTIGTFS